MKNVKISLAAITTPHRFLLRGLFFGDKRAKNIFIYIHGLGGNMFYHAEVLGSLSDSRTAVLAFNNRGSGIINTVKRFNPHKTSGSESIVIGVAHEVFSDCVDDIDGAVRWAKAAGAKNIYLIGHSTGCQKSIYYLSQHPQSPVRGAILLAPISDYADAYAQSDKKLYRRALATAKQMVKTGRQHELMPISIKPYNEILDAQRWLSLYNPDSREEIFSYASGRRPTALLQNKKPVLVVLAEKDEFGDRPASAIAAWFQVILAGRDARVKIIKSAAHNFADHFTEVRSLVRAWAAQTGK